MGLPSTSLQLLLVVVTLVGLLLLLPRLSSSLPTPQHSPSLTLRRIAYGSCNKPHLKNEMWPHIRHFDLDLWIWLGDVVYTLASTSSSTTTLRHHLHLLPPPPLPPHFHLHLFRYHDLRHLHLHLHLLFLLLLSPSTPFSYDYLYLLFTRGFSSHLSSSHHLFHIIIAIMTWEYWHLSFLSLQHQRR